MLSKWIILKLVKLIETKQKMCIWRKGNQCFMYIKSLSVPIQHWDLFGGFTGKALKGWFVWFGYSHKFY